MNNNQFRNRQNLLILKNSLWCFGIAAWLFGITDRTIACFSDSYLSATDITQLFTAAFFFVSWLYLKPKQIVNYTGVYQKFDGKGY